MVTMVTSSLAGATIVMSLLFGLYACEARSVVGLPVKRSGVDVFSLDDNGTSSRFGGNFTGLPVVFGGPLSLKVVILRGSSRSAIVRKLRLECSIPFQTPFALPAPYPHPEAEFRRASPLAVAGLGAIRVQLSHSQCSRNARPVGERATWRCASRPRQRSAAGAHFRGRPIRCQTR